MLWHKKQGSLIVNLGSPEKLTTRSVRRFLRKFLQDPRVVNLPRSLWCISGSATAELYKWRDDSGVVRYSENPPVANAVKASPSEIVNSIQAKDLCAKPTKVSAKTEKKPNRLAAKPYGFFAVESSNGDVASAEQLLNAVTGTNREKLDLILNATAESDLAALNQTVSNLSAADQKNYLENIIAYLLKQECRQMISRN